MTDERRKAFEDILMGIAPTPNIEPYFFDNGSYDPKAQSAWLYFNAAIAYMESRLDSPEVVEKVANAIKGTCYTWEDTRSEKLMRIQQAKQALAALKGSL